MFQFISLNTILIEYGTMFKKRTISYCQFKMEKKGTDIKDTYPFITMLNYIEKSDTSVRSVDFVDSEKVVGVESIERHVDGHIWIVFKTGRYGHTAPLINKEDGSERVHDKSINEGEKELTHVCLRIYPEYVVCSLENNKYGLSATNLTSYFNHFLTSIGSDLLVSLSYLSMKGISDVLEKAQRIFLVEMECSFQKTDEDLFRRLYGENSKETFIVKMSPERAKSLEKSEVVKIYNEMAPGGKVSRMKISIKSDEGNNMILDTLLDKVREEEKFDVDQNGVVISSLIFPILQNRLLNFED